jgi:poly-gamma-glutamate system protein
MIRRDGRTKAVYVLAVLSVLFLALAMLIAERPLPERGQMLRAARLMQTATERIERCREKQGIAVDPVEDINRTGLIGLENSPITTSLGNLGAKRTTVNPNFAALVVRLLCEAGVRSGDPVAIGASSSFPALVVATLCAIEALGGRSLLICSLGASQWGANRPDFSWLEIQECLRWSGTIEVKPIALSLGGEGDVGQDMNPAGRSYLTRRAEESGVLFLTEPNLEKNVERRLSLYRAAAGEKAIRAFVNIGGGYANMGTDSEILKVNPGLATFSRIPPLPQRGVIFEMAARGVPVIHLLYVKGLCERYGLPWDPRPLPQPGQGQIFREKAIAVFPFSLFAGADLLACVLILVFIRKMTAVT